MLLIREQQISGGDQSTDKTGCRGSSCFCGLRLTQLHQQWLLLWSSIWDQLVFSHQGTAASQSSTLLLMVDLSIWAAVSRSWWGYEGQLQWLERQGTVLSLSVGTRWDSRTKWALSPLLKRRQVSLLLASHKQPRAQQPSAWKLGDPLKKKKSEKSFPFPRVISEEMEEMRPVTCSPCPHVWPEGTASVCSCPW